MKLALTSILILLTSLFSVGIQANDLSPLDSVVTYNGHLKKLHKEEFVSNEAGYITKANGFVWSDEKWTSSYTTDYTYDTEGNLLSEVKTMQGSPNYVERKNVFSYDNNNNFISEEFFFCNSQTQLIGIGKYTYKYAPNQLITEVVESAWEASTSTWVETTIYTYEYDSNQNQTLIEVQKKSLSSPKWERDTRTKRTFNTSNILTEESIYKGSFESWVKTSKIENLLNSDNTFSKIINYKNNGQNEWVYSNQYVYEYADNRLQAINSSIWNGAAWVLHSKDDYTYTGQELSSIKSNFKKNNNSWSTYMEKYFSNNSGIKLTEQYNIDAKGTKRGVMKNIIQTDNRSSSDESFSWEDGQWISQKRNMVSYNEDAQVSSLEKYSNNLEYYKSDFHYTNDGRIFTEDGYDWFQADWALGRRVQYFYADSITSIDNSQSNPTIKIHVGINIINIESESPVKNVKVFSLTGKLIHNGSESQINTSSWDKTAYIVSVTTRLNEHKASKVLIK